MGKVGQKIVKGLQLDHKWVRVMLSISIVLVVGLLFYPSTKISYMTSSKESKVMLDTTRVDIEKSTSITIEGNDTIVRHHINVPTVSRPVNRTIASVDTISKSEPIQVQIVEEKKPFDWKGTVTWIIGLINGMVLVVLNLKNIFKKTP
jgi:hypothetical protein